MTESKFTILLVDDELVVLNSAAKFLENEGYQVLKASQSDDALVLLNDFVGTVHLLLTDVHMGPYLNGFELAKCSRMLRPKIAVLYISGMNINIMVEQEVEEGRATFLPKPFTPQELLDSVRQAMHTSLTEGEVTWSQWSDVDLGIKESPVQGARGFDSA